ncbi:hypothetical protein LV779_30120 [Streptomyces thinghirensis]|nr:hypothetical protein [Streptomyces thinghirensis]
MAHGGSLSGEHGDGRGAGGTAAEDVRRGDGRPLRAREGRLGPGRPPPTRGCWSARRRST